MEMMTYQDYEQLVQGLKGEWYNGRWSYYEPVIALVKEVAPQSILEIGPGGHTIVKQGDILVRPDDDYWGRPTAHIAQVIEHDATEKPWPIAGDVRKSLQPLSQSPGDRDALVREGDQENQARTRQRQRNALEHPHVCAATPRARAPCRTGRRQVITQPVSRP